MVSAVCYCRSADIREFKQRQQRERQNSNRFIEQNKTFARASRFLYISLPLLHNYDVKMPIFMFYGGRKQATTKFSFSF